VDPRRVPNFPVEIDWNHPLAQNLLYLCIPASPHGYTDLTGINPPLSEFVTPAFAGTANGPGFYAPATSNGTASALLPSVPPALQVLQGTVACGGLFLAVPENNYPHLFGCSTYFIGSGGATSPVNLYVGGVNNSITLANLSAPAQFVGTYEFSANGTFGFYNGVLAGDYYAGTPSYTTASPFGFGTGNASNGSILTFGAVWGSTLGFTLEAWLAAEPFAMLRPRFASRLAMPSSGGPTILYSFGRAAFMTGARASVAGLGAIAAAARSESLASANAVATNAATGRAAAVDTARNAAAAIGELASEALSLSSAHSLPSGITAASGRDSVTTASKALAASAGAIVGVARQTSSATAEASATVQGYATSAATSTGRGALSTAAFLAGAALAGSVSFARAAASAAAAIVGIDRQTSAATAKAAATTEAQGQATSVSTGRGALSTAAYLVATALASSVSFARATVSGAGALVGIDRQGSAAAAKPNATASAQGQATSVSTGRGAVSAAVFLAANALASSVSFARAGASLTASVVGRATGGSAARAGQAATTGATARAVNASGTRGGLGGIIGALGRAFAAAFGRGSISTGSMPPPQIIVELAPDVRSITLSK